MKHHYVGARPARAQIFMIVLVAQLAARRLHLCGDFLRANAIMGINLATTAVARRRADALAYLWLSLSS